MKCSKCEQHNPDHAKFCSGCGTHLVLRCGACDEALPGGAKFCLNCGHAVVTSIAAPDRIGPPASYTPKHLAERILTAKSTLEGERKQVTVLFADLKGSMEMLADRDPEDARQLLDAVLERMMEAVHRYEGTVNQIMGDGIMALFGAPLAHEDHAIRASYAALRMQTSVKQYAKELQRCAGSPVQIRVGLNSGDVVVRSIGGDLHMDYTAVGHTTHLAARMEQMALPGSILMVSDTLRLAEGYIEVKRVGAVPVKGLPAPVDIYELIGPGPLRSRFHIAAARGLTRFVGRNSELEQLYQALGRAASGHGQVLGITGEPGVGKSRLVWEMIHSAHAQDWLILRTSASSYEKATAYFPIVEILKTFFQIDEHDDHRKIRDKVVGALRALGDDITDALVALLALLDVAVDDPSWQALDPPHRRQRIVDAVKRLFLRQSQVQPLLLVFEDLQWIDTETQSLLDSLVESMSAARLLLLVTYRLEYDHSWGSKTDFAQLRLNALPPSTAQGLVQALVGDAPPLRPLSQVVIERTEGNPFFIEETVRTLVETGILVGTKGAYQLGKRLEAIPVPSTVQAVLAARVDRLPASERTILQAASVIGKDLSFNVLRKICQQPEETLRNHLAHLQAAEFLYETHGSADREYTFTHALTHDVVYGSLLKDQRRAIHAAIVDAIEQLYPDRLSEHLERLAHHAIHADAWEKALDYARQAARKAFVRSAHQHAVAWLDQTLNALRRLPESRARIEMAIDIRFDLRASLLPLGEFTKILAHLREAENLAGMIEDRGRLGRVYAYLTDYFRQIGDYDRALDTGRNAIAIAEEQNDLSIRVATNIYFGHVYHNVGDYGRAAQLFRNNVDLLAGDLKRERFGLPYVAAVHSRTWLIWCLAERGDLIEGVKFGEEALQISTAVDQPPGLTSASAYSGLSRVLLRKGDISRALPLLERGLEVAKDANILLWIAHFSAELGHAYALAGRVAEALPLLQQSIEQWGWMRGTAGQSIRLVALAEAHLLGNRTDEALPLAERGLRLARRHGERGHEAHALRILAEIMSVPESPSLEKAEPLYREAVALAEKLEMRPLTAHCYFGLGKLHLRAGQPAHNTYLITAAQLYQAMDMLVLAEEAQSQTERLR